MNIKLSSILQLLFHLVVTAIVLCIIALSVKFGFYYYKEVYPYKAVVQQILTNASVEHRNLSQSMQAMIDTDFYCADDNQVKRTYSFTLSGDGSCGYYKDLQVTKLVQYHPSSNYQPKRNVRNQFHQLMLNLFIVSPLSQQDQNTIIAELTYFQPQPYIRGYNQFSQFYFNKPLSQLSLEEQATVIAISKGPSYYLRNKQLLKRRQNLLLSYYALIIEKQ